MDISPLVLAIPMYFTLIGLELLVERISRKSTYRLNDALTNINNGVFDQVTGTFLLLFSIGIYTLVYEHTAIYSIGRTWATFALLFVLWDLCYYWSHRMQHEISLFWGGHVVHHQSEEYNLSVALRQSGTSKFWAFMFYLPLAVIGFDPMQVVLAGGINLLYQFWIHTEHIGKFPGWIEAVFNTPSHHRVHHGKDPKYIDKNYAGVFIVWDRLFGTFQKEEERPNYGITKALQSWNPVYANFAHYIDLFNALKKSRSLGDSLQILFRKPGWMPSYLGGYQAPSQVPPDYHKYDKMVVSFTIRAYVLLHFVISLGVVAFYMFTYKALAMDIRLLLAAWTVWTMMSFAFIFESRKSWVAISEIARLCSLGGVLYLISLSGVTVSPLLAVLTGLVIIVSALFFLFNWRRSDMTPVQTQTE